MKRFSLKKVLILLSAVICMSVLFCATTFAADNTAEAAPLTQANNAITDAISADASSNVAAPAVGGVAGGLAGANGGAAIGAPFGATAGNVAGAVNGTIAGNAVGGPIGSAIGSAVGAVANTPVGAVTGTLAGAVKGAVPGTVLGSIASVANPVGKTTGAALGNAVAIATELAKDAVKPIVGIAVPVKASEGLAIAATQPWVSTILGATLASPVGGLVGAAVGNLAGRATGLAIGAALGGHNNLVPLTPTPILGGLNHRIINRFINAAIGATLFAEPNAVLGTIIGFVNGLGNDAITGGMLGWTLGNVARSLPIYNLLKKVTIPVEMLRSVLNKNLEIKLKNLLGLDPLFVVKGFKNAKNTFDFLEFVGAASLATLKGINGAIFGAATALINPLTIIPGLINALVFHDALPFIGELWAQPNGIGLISNFVFSDLGKAINFTELKKLVYGFFGALLGSALSGVAGAASGALTGLVFTLINHNKIIPFVATKLLDFVPAALFSSWTNILLPLVTPLDIAVFVGNILLVDLVLIPFNTFVSVAHMLLDHHLIKAVINNGIITAMLGRLGFGALIGLGLGRLFAFLRFDNTFVFINMVDRIFHYVLGRQLNGALLGAAFGFENGVVLGNTLGIIPNFLKANLHFLNGLFLGKVAHLAKVDLLAGTLSPLAGIRGFFKGVRKAIVLSWFAIPAVAAVIAKALSRLTMIFMLPVVNAIDIIPSFFRIAATTALGAVVGSLADLLSGAVLGNVAGVATGALFNGLADAVLFGIAGVLAGALLGWIPGAAVASIALIPLNMAIGAVVGTVAGVATGALVGTPVGALLGAGLGLALSNGSSNNATVTIPTTTPVVTVPTNTQTSNENASDNNQNASSNTVSAHVAATDA